MITRLLHQRHAALDQEFKSRQLKLSGEERFLKLTQCLDVLTATTSENLYRVHHLLMDDNGLTMNQIANAYNITRERVDNIARSGARFQTPDQKHTG